MFRAILERDVPILQMTFGKLRLAFEGVGHEVEYIEAAYLQMYRQLRDAFVLASDTERLLLDLAPDLVEIDEALVEVEELAPFSAVAGGRVDQLENERSARHDALAAWQEIAPDDADSGGIGYYF